MFPEHDTTHEKVTLRLMDLHRNGKLTQVEICDALQEEYQRGWEARAELLRIRLSWLPWGLRHAVGFLVRAD